MNLYGVLYKAVKRKVFFVVLMFFILGDIANGVVNYNGINETKYTEPILAILPLLSMSNCVCVVSKNEEILSLSLKTAEKEYKVVVLDDYCTLFPIIFDSILIIDMDVSITCSVVFSKVSRASVYIINSELTLTDMTQLEQCVANISSPEVIIVSLQDGSVFALSHVFLKPRRFFKISLSQLMLCKSRPQLTDLGGSIINAVSIVEPPFTIFDSEAKQEEFDGQFVLLLKELAKRLNFSINYHTYKSWGLLLSNGTFISGMGQAMQGGNPDVAVALVWQIHSAYHFMDFGPPLDRSEIHFLVRRPTQIDFQWHTFVTLLEPEVWVATTAVFVLTVIVYYCDIKMDNPQKESWIESILTVFGHFIMTTSHRENGRNTRCILTSWSSFSLLLSVYYCSITVTRLTLPTFSPRVNTLRHLVEGNYYWTAPFYAEFKTVEFKESIFNFKNYWHYEFEKTYIYMESEAIRAKIVSDEKLTFFVNTFGNGIVAFNAQGLYGNKAMKMYRVAREVVNKNYVTFGVKKNSPLLEPLNLHAQRFLEVGLTKAWMDQVLRRWPVYDSKYIFHEQDIPTISKAQQLRLKNVLQFIYLLLLGLSISFLVFLVELMWRSSWNSFGL